MSAKGTHSFVFEDARSVRDHGGSCQNFASCTREMSYVPLAGLLRKYMLHISEG